MITFGVKVQYLDNTNIKIIECNGEFKNIDESKHIYLENSKISSNFILNLNALFPKDSSIIYYADKGINVKPIIQLINTLKNNNLIDIKYLEKQESFPLKVTSLRNARSVNFIQIENAMTYHSVSSLLL